MRPDARGQVDFYYRFQEKARGREPGTSVSVLLLVPGFNGDGRKFLSQEAGTRFADQQGVVLVSPSFHTTVDEIRAGRGYYYPALGSGAETLAAIQQIAGKEKFSWAAKGGASLRLPRQGSCDHATGRLLEHLRVLARRTACYRASREEPGPPSGNSGGLSLGRPRPHLCEWRIRRDRTPRKWRLLHRQNQGWTHKLRYKRPAWDDACRRVRHRIADHSADSFWQTEDGCATTRKARAAGGAGFPSQTSLQPQTGKTP